MMERGERAVWAALASDLTFGARHFAQLRSVGIPLRELWTVSTGERITLGVEPGLAEHVERIKAAVEPDETLDKLESSGVTFLTVEDEAYPALLKEIAVPPAVLYVRGVIPAGPAIAVVGTRKMTTYGKRATDDLVSVLARTGITIVSGLALGVDGAAHRATLAAKGRTVAVLPSGIDAVYPASHRFLANEIIKQAGAVITEFPPGTAALQHHFPVRNRIIAGMSQATVVIEAAIQSGSLLTARSALEANRDVFAVPGSIYSPLSAGPHHLIQLGAKLVHSAEDLLVETGLAHAGEEAAVREVIPDSAEEAALLDVLGPEPLLVDDLIAAVQLDPQVTLSTLTLMEMKGRVRNLGGNQYVRR
ncbi:DNA-protecting protein DprA [Candidatus Berkelbacteria bacterium]|nr:DNA-protecting protein DprA [Candidatus Berkelbacteria bacterium]